ncbi:DUF2795 domain-containing protein [Streptomyces sp. SID3343]|uniref:DUF2795 domain-containing protein n=1 Tax=Streptomyces sp. SID3343 TaxID=2690260 RepID=UPI00136A35B7|nr:DUF2795 domain-containing protein [Streptomyces sp. SID3343]MYV98100.1 DUF2795 domain-containing protein [Streptomyces sp. SID3343]
MLTSIGRSVVEPLAVQCALWGVTFPAHPDALAAVAIDNGAEPAVARALAALPERSYEGPNQVCMALCGRHAAMEPGL